MRPAKKQKWRLSKTLARNVDFRPIEDEDIRFAYAAYKTGALEEMFEETDLDAAQFKQVFEDVVVNGFHAAWTVFADNKAGYSPIGLVFGRWHPSTEGVMVVSGIAWFPWASERNIIEGTVKFFNEVRKEMQMVGYARPEQKRLYEICLKHGIMRRIGTSHIMFDTPATVFETREI